MNHISLLLISAVCALTATPAFAELPAPVRALVQAAIASGDEKKVATVIELARQTNPNDGAELDALHDTFKADLKLAEARLAAEERERIRNAGALQGWSGEGELGAFRSTGNTRDVGVTVGAKLARKGIEWSHNVRALVDFQRTNGVTTREQLLAAYEPHYNISPRFYAYGLGQWDRDRFQGFSSRVAASGGFGYRVIDAEAMRLEVKGGPAWRRTDFTDGSDASDLAALGAVTFSWQIAENLRLTEDANAFLQSGNKSFVSATGLEATINAALKARLSYTIEHDTAPPPGAIKTDTLTRFTLIYGF